MFSPKLTLIFITLFLGAAGLLVAQDDNLARYTALNDKETRLSEFKDNPEVLALKVKMLAVVNASRAGYGADPVELDILASRVANKQCAEGAQGGFSGHWNLRGEKPYLRYALAGGRDHVAENASSLSSTGDLDPAKIWNYMNDCHARFMAEVPPMDGHKTNIIEKKHTHVGLGLALIGSQFRFYEEFIDRYLETLEGPAEAKTGQPVTIRAVPRKGWFGYLLTAFYEPIPQPMTAAEADAKGSYPDFTSERAFSFWPYQLNILEDGSFSQEVTFTKPGYYYIQVYLDTQLPAKSGKFSAKDKVQSSGLVILVKD